MALKGFLNAFFHFNEVNRLIGECLVEHAAREPSEKAPAWMMPSPVEKP
jgi:hypothetical protein